MVEGFVLAEQLDKLRISAERGRQYSTSLDSLAHIFDTMEITFQEAIVDSGLDEHNLREEYYRMLKTLGLMRELFTQIVSQGLISANEIEYAAKIATGQIKDFH